MTLSFYDDFIVTASRKEGVAPRKWGSVARKGDKRDKQVAFGLRDKRDKQARLQKRLQKKYRLEEIESVENGVDHVLRTPKHIARRALKDRREDRDDEKFDIIHPPPKIGDIFDVCFWKGTYEEVLPEQIQSCPGCVLELEHMGFPGYRYFFTKKYVRFYSRDTLETINTRFRCFPEVKVCDWCVRNHIFRQEQKTRYDTESEEDSFSDIYTYCHCIPGVEVCRWCRSGGSKVPDNVIRHSDDYCHCSCSFCMEHCVHPSDWTPPGSQSSSCNVADYYGLFEELPSPLVWTPDDYYIRDYINPSHTPYAQDFMTDADYWDYVNFYYPPFRHEDGPILQDDVFG